ncbi:MAG: DNA polymerase III subunit delta [Clostridia bacterium]|nr:DNA polymerase III subunit delta [Clostridia bacterium]
MKFQELKKNLAEKIANLYYIKGDDAFLRHKAVEMIEARAVTFRDLNILRFDDETTDINNIVSACRALPMMDERRVVVLKDIAVKKQDDLKPLIEYAKNPTPSTVLVIVNGIGGVVYKKFEELAEVIDCSKLDVPMLERLVLSDLNKYKCKINSDALDRLIEYCGLDYTRINNETIKLANLIGEGETITLELVNENVNREIEYDIFELSNAAISKDGIKAVAIINQLLERKEAPQKLLMLIQSSFRRMFYAINSKEGIAEIAQKLGVKEFAVKKSREQATRFTPVRLKKILDLGAQLDFQIKSGEMSDVNALYLFVTSICE